MTWAADSWRAQKCLVCREITISAKSIAYILRAFIIIACFAVTVIVIPVMRGLRDSSSLCSLPGRRDLEWETDTCIASAVAKIVSDGPP